MFSTMPNNAKAYVTPQSDSFLKPVFELFRLPTRGLPSYLLSWLFLIIELLWFNFLLLWGYQTCGNDLLQNSIVLESTLRLELPHTLLEGALCVLACLSLWALSASHCSGRAGTETVPCFSWRASPAGRPREQWPLVSELASPSM